MIKYILSGLASFMLLVAIGWFLVANDTAMMSVFLPKQEQIRRNTFEQSKAYRQGMVQELQSMQFQYVQADQAHKTALASLIKHRAADFPKDDMPPDLQQFIESLP